MRSSYQRSLYELPLGSRRVVVRLRVRRYFCARQRCSRKTFVEQVPGLTERHRRASVGVAAVDRGGVGRSSGGPTVPRAAAGRGPDRLLQLLTAPGRAPRVLGGGRVLFRLSRSTWAARVCNRADPLLGVDAALELPGAVLLGAGRTDLSGVFLGEKPVRGTPAS